MQHNTHSTLTAHTAEVVKRHVPGLHQVVSISSVAIADLEPREGFKKPEDNDEDHHEGAGGSRYASVIEIKLSKEVCMCVGGVSVV